MSADCGAALVAGAVDDICAFVEVPGAAACAGADVGIIRARTGQSNHGRIRLLISAFAGLKECFTAWLFKD